MAIAKTLKIGHLNIYTGNPKPAEALKEVITARRPDSLGLNEAYRFVGDLDEWAPRYRPFWGTPGEDKRRGSLDNPILVRKSHTSLSELSIYGSASSEPVKIAPERYITAVGYKHPLGNIAHIEVHPHAAVEGLDTKKSDRARKYDIFMQRLLIVARMYQELHYAVFITGDFQLTENGKLINGITPVKLANKLKMNYSFVHIDAIIYPRDFIHDKDKDTTILRKSVTHSDHDGFIKSFRR